ncbi:hypothetical protein KDL29_06805 [bacterium]|nr:hypothetical protein [bacterium]
MKAISILSLTGIGAALLGLTLAACGGGSDTAVPQERNTLAKAEGFITSGPAQATALPGSDYDIKPLLTVGDEVPLLTGTWPNLQSHPNKTFALAGLPDGLGSLRANGYNWVWVNHEMSAGNLTDFSKTISGQIDGARVSIFKFNDEWECLGGMNLVDTIKDASGKIGEIKLQGNKVTQWGYAFSRFCSSSLSTQFAGGDPVYFPGEETSGGRGWAIYTNGSAVAIDDAQRCARENNVPLRGYTEQAVLCGLDDSTNRPFVLYVGDKDNQDPDGLKSGKSYVLNLEDGSGNFIQNTGALSVGGSYTVSWTEIPAEYKDNQAGYYAWSAAADWRGSDFVRLEDGQEDPNKDLDFYFVTTGSNGTYDVYGSLFKLEFNEADPLGNATLTLVAEGGPGSFLSPDNITIDEDGYLYAQEDINGGAPINQLIAENRNGSIWRMKLDGSEQQRIITQDQTPYDGVNTAGALVGIGADIWETSGIIEVDTGAGSAKLLFSVQAHSVNDPADMNDGNYYQGGQLVLATPSN